jgi:formylglycine-generating enzyme required for sulfatase activity
LLLFASNGRAASDEKVDLGNGVTMELVRVEAGSYLQGSPPEEPQRAPDETQHEVVLTRPFYIGKFPVTYGQFMRFVEETQFRTEAEVGTSGGYGWEGTQLVQRREFTWRHPGYPQTNNHPVVLVTYPDAEAFTNWLSRKTGRKFRLPTEAQWEYACRAGTTTTFSSADSPAKADAMIWHKGNSPNGAQPVGGKMPNAWGIHDMLGQTWEWCEDFYGPYAPGRVVDPLATTPGPGERPRRVLRGGSWLKDLFSCRAATRYRNDPKSRNADNGFRLVTFDAARVSAAPAIPPAPQEPRLEREDPVAAPATEQIHPSPVQPVQIASRPSRSRSFGPVALFFWGLIAIVVFKVLRTFLRNITPPPMPNEPLREAPQAGTLRATGELTTRVVDDGFWIQSNELSPGTLLTCRYTLDEGSREVGIRFDPGHDGHFVFTGSRPRAVSVVVVPRGGSAPIAQNDPATWIDPQREEDNRRGRFRGFPPAY